MCGCARGVTTSRLVASFHPSPLTALNFATSAGMTIHNIETLPKGGSDHLPIVVTSTYRAEEAVDAA